MRLDQTLKAIATAGTNALHRQAQRLDSSAQLLSALSPEATLKRGYSLSLIDGKAVRDASTLTPGQTVTTLLAKGQFTSTVNETSSTQ